MDAELRFHFDRAFEEHLASGMSVEAARSAATRSVGSIAHAKVQCREPLGLTIVDQVPHDLRYALRQLRRSPGFTTAIILSLAAGIGFCVAVFAAAEALLREPFSYRNAARMTVPTVYYKA